MRKLIFITLLLTSYSLVGQEKPNILLITIDDIAPNALSCYSLGMQYPTPNIDRIAKTTKVACFLNGDGEAKIIYGDGLAPFNSSLYYGKLNNGTGEKDNPVFDTIIANPPFSVESFRMVLENGKVKYSPFARPLFFQI